MKLLPVGRFTKPTLLGLDSQREATNPDLLIRLNHGAFFAWDLSAGNQGWVSTFRSQPEAALIVEGQRRVHTTDFRIAFQRHIHLYRSRTATNSDLSFGNLDD